MDEQMYVIWLTRFQECTIFLYHYKERKKYINNRHERIKQPIYKHIYHNMNETSSHDAAYQFLTNITV